jgi:hypothetical protein
MKSGLILRMEKDLIRKAKVAASSPAGRHASECLDRLRELPPVLLDEGFGEDLLEVLQEEAPEERAQGVAREVE